MKQFKTFIREIRGFGILWLTQVFSALGSAMTNFALILWLYQETGSALTTAMLSVCSYAPYVMMSIFAGALSDKWNKKAVLLVCDSFAAACTVGVWALLAAGKLQIWHLYCLNALNGLMNTIQQPAADVTITLITPKKHYQTVSAMRSFSNALVNILTPAAASAVYALLGLQAVIIFDLFTFAVAFMTLLCFVKIPEVEQQEADGESVLESAKQGLKYLKENRGILHLIYFLAAINFTASVYEAAKPALLLSGNNGGEVALGVLNTVIGISMLAGSFIAAVLPTPKSRVRVICNTLLLSMSTENFFLAFGRSTAVYCAGAAIAWVVIPIMNSNMEVLFRDRIPVSMQGRVYAARNTLQFFTIPLGYMMGGWLVDAVFEPFMAAQQPDGILCTLFGTGKGSGAALLFFVIAFLGIITCLVFRKDRLIWELEK